MFERFYSNHNAIFVLGYCLILCIICSVLSTNSIATETPIKDKDSAIELNPFNTDQLRTRYYALIGELRCPKCQNQNLADSDAPIAADLRNELQRLLHEEYSDQQILDFMTARYGHFVLYEPPLNRQTIVLWLLPSMLLIFCLYLLIKMIKKDRSALPKEEIKTDRQHVNKQVEQLLNRFEEDK